MCDATDLRMRDRAAECLAVDRLAGGALHEIRPAKPHERRALHHHDEIGQRGEIRAASDALPHHRGELRNAQVPAHDGVVIEDPARAVLAWKYAALIRQVHPRRIDEVDDRDTTAHRHFLSAQHLPDRLGPPGTGLHRGIIRDDDNGPAVHDAHARDDTGRRRRTVVLVVREQQADFNEAGPDVAQPRDALARRELSLLVLLLDLVHPATQAEAVFERAQLGAQLAEPCRHE